MSVTRNIFEKKEHNEPFGDRYGKIEDYDVPMETDTPDELLQWDYETHLADQEGALEKVIRKDSAASLLEAIPNGNEFNELAWLHPNQRIKIELSDKKEAFWLNDPHGVEVNEATEVFIPNLVRCTAYVFHIGNDRRFYLHSNMPARPDLLIKAAQYIWPSLESVEFFTNDKLHNLGITDAAQQLTKLTNIPVRGHEIDTFFGGDEPNYGSSLLFDREDVHLVGTPRKDDPFGPVVLATKPLFKMDGK